MTYCLGITTRHGLIMASDSRTNAGFDQVNKCRKMHTFCRPGERLFIILASGSLSLTQSILTLLRRDFDKGEGLAAAETMYDASRVIGNTMRQIGEIDRRSLERDEFRFNVHFLLGGQIGEQPHDLYLIYPQGNPLNATADSPFLQIGETKYGRPILDRGVRYGSTTLEEGAKLALLSLDSAMRSNVTVGPPVDLALYRSGDLDISRYRRFRYRDEDLQEIHTQWEQALRKSVQELPEIQFKPEDRPPDESGAAAAIHSS